jgi:hypothetical protein
MPPLRRPRRSEADRLRAGLSSAFATGRDLVRTRREAAAFAAAPAFAPPPGPQAGLAAAGGAEEDEEREGGEAAAAAAAPAAEEEVPAASTIILALPPPGIFGVFSFLKQLSQPRKPPHSPETSFGELELTLYIYI